MSYSSIMNCYASFLNDVTRLFKRFKLVKQSWKEAHLNYWSDCQRPYFLHIHSKQPGRYLIKFSKSRIMLRSFQISLAMSRSSLRLTSYMPDKLVAILFNWSLNAKSSEFLLVCDFHPKHGLKLYNSKRILQWNRNTVVSKYIFQITLLDFAQKLIEVARKIEKSCRKLQNKIFGNNIEHCTP